ncbi:MOSC domain-containing protein [Dyadobacter arcticus]|uniref:MOSC domain-containing protein n=1 Tax=Dyadobacter arcticus TaxID=1078754 RepID=A0ABX0UMA8_9BACT|nr:MOSC N-terminal beta barrel domain-containing protein [Dyadobacter arcticus]NIJ52810.1 hypothetical protein [Dyadobacter arcticus]
MKLSEIWIYPVKSLGGIRLLAAQVEDCGLQYDRRWMVVDENGKFLTQRVHANMALLDVSLDPNGLILSNRLDTEQQVLVPFDRVSDEAVEVRIWDDVVTAFTVCNVADQWLTNQLGKKVRIVAMTDETKRKRNPDYTSHGELVSFADDFPYLLISQASLDDLNGKLDSPVEMKRFRPNFVVSGTLPFAEDAWKYIKIGNAGFEAANACERCIMVNIDPKTGMKSPEPLKALFGYRWIDKKIFFGRNMVCVESGIVCEGDEIVLV